MKTISLLLSLLIFLIPPIAYAATTPTLTQDPSPTVASKSADHNVLDQQINNLKDKIASRVAQLKLVEKRGIIGTVSEVSESQITLTDLQGNARYVEVDELTKFNNPNSKSFGLSDITKGTMIGILGLYNKEAHKILARFIDSVSYPQVLSGVVVSVDRKNYLLHIATVDKSDIPVDIETFSKIYIYTKENDQQKSGFSKITQGERLIAIGFPDKNNKSHILASRVILFPDITVNPKITLPSSITPSSSSAVTPTLAPSTGGGKKLYPLPSN